MISIVKWFNGTLNHFDEEDNVTNTNKCLFILTNVIYFLPLLYFGPTANTLVLATIGIISCIFHTHQCVEGSCKDTTIKLMWLDVVLAGVLGVYLWFKNIKHINKFCYLLLFSAAFCFSCTDVDNSDYKSKCETYMFYHGMWHVLSGILFAFIIFLSFQEGTNLNVESSIINEVAD